MVNFRKRGVVLMTALLISVGTPVANAGGALESTQWLNKLQLVAMYTKQLEQIQQELLNFKINPFEAMGPEVTQLVRDIGQIMDAGDAIGGSFAKISSNIANKYNNYTAMTYSEKFRSLTGMTQQSLTASMKAAGMRRDQYKSNAAALSALYAKSQHTVGSLGALQMVSEINVEQLKQFHALGDLVASGQIAMADYQKSELAMKEKMQDDIDAIKGGFQAIKPRSNIVMKYGIKALD